MEYFLSEIASVTGGILVGEDLKAENVSVDSRSGVCAGTLFFAISGVNHDGHDYIGQLFEKGVRMFVVEKQPDIDASFIVVNDTIAALQALAAYHRSKFGGEVVAITGSNGKTIVKEWIAQMWNPTFGKLTRSPRSWNSQIGVALSLLRIEGDEKVCVIEAGISQKGEMEKLEKMIRPTIGILTCIGTAHLENFENSKQLREEKMILFKGVKKLITAEGNTIDERNLFVVRALYEYLGLPFDSGRHLENVAMRMEHAEGILGSHIINDSYNSDYLSFPMVLDHMEHYCSVEYGKRIAILSDFREEVSYVEIDAHLRSHAFSLLIGIGPKMSANAGQFTIPSMFFKNTEEFLKDLDTSIFKKALILIKGGRSWGMERISAALESRTHTTTHHINLSALAWNLSYYRKHLPEGHPVMAMVKASGYGSGDVEIARFLQGQGVQYLDVAFADEGVILREGGITAPIVVLNGDPGSFATMIHYRLEPEIYSFEALEQFYAEVVKAGETDYPVHLKLDTGMHRLGFMEPETDTIIESLKGKPAIHVASVFSHFAASEDLSEDEFTRKQIAVFKRMTDKIVAAFPYKILKHICNTAGILRFPEAHFDMVRVGIGLYGAEDSHLQVVSTLETRIVQTKWLQEGETVGYNRHGKVEKGGKRIAIIPIGYADGLDRKLSRGNASFDVGGVMCPTCGNICMDTTMLDITDAPDAKEGDRVVIFGENPKVEDIARCAGTISYEILTSISKRIKKIYQYD